MTQPEGNCRQVSVHAAARGVCPRSAQIKGHAAGVARKGLDGDLGDAIPSTDVQVADAVEPPGPLGSPERKAKLDVRHLRQAGRIEVDVDANQPKQDK